MRRATKEAVQIPTAKQTTKQDAPHRQTEKSLRTAGTQGRIPTNIMFILRFFKVGKQYVFAIYTPFPLSASSFYGTK